MGPSCLQLFSDCSSKQQRQFQTYITDYRKTLNSLVSICCNFNKEVNRNLVLSSPNSKYLEILKKKKEKMKYLIASLSNMVPKLWCAQPFGLFLLHWKTITLSSLISGNNDLFVQCGLRGVAVCACVFICWICASPRAVPQCQLTAQ